MAELFDFNFLADNWALSIALLLLFILLLMASAFFSSTETAYSSVNLIRLRNYLEEKKKGAKKAVYIAEKFDVALTTILVGNNFVNIAATTVATFIASQTILNPTWSNIISTVLMTIIILTFGEIIPKANAKENAEKTALRNSGVMFILIKVLWPITYLFIKLRKGLFKKKAQNATSPMVTEDELESIIDTMETEGVIDKDNAELLQSAIDLSEKTVYDIMTPRVDIIAIEINDTIDKIRDQFLEYQFSRMPVYEGDKDHILGVLRERDFFATLILNKEVNIRKLLSEPLYVSKSTKVDDLLRKMQIEKTHFAIVSDEYGGTSGVVTMEDALEELVGEIYDEYDDEEIEKITKIDENKYLLSSDMEVEELYEELKLGFPPYSKYANIGGMLYEASEVTPYEGMKLTFDAEYEEESIENPVHIFYRLEYTIKKVENRRIRLVELLIREVDMEDKE
ncbi:MAG: hemolysin family protein [Bacilli bacterium]|nr:hemolysin family protein [Bacilli bacterium]